MHDYLLIFLLLIYFLLLLSCFYMCSERLVKVSLYISKIFEGTVLLLSTVIVDIFQIICFFVHKSAMNIYIFFLTDALLRKAFATPSFQGYSFVSSFLVLLGLIKVRLNCFSIVYHFVMRVIHLSFLYSMLLRVRTRWSLCLWFPATSKPWSMLSDRTISRKRTWLCCRPSCSGKGVTEWDNQQACCRYKIQKL